MNSTPRGEGVNLLVTEKLHRAGSSLYLGRTNNKPIFGSREDHLLVLGPMRCGKTSGLITPSVAVHPGPVVVVSTRDDVVAATSRPRAIVANEHGGEVLEVALGGSVINHLTGSRWSVTDGCGEWNVAIERASVLAQAAVGGSKETFWKGATADLLSGCLHAAALVGDSDQRMARYVRSADVDYYLGVVSDRYDDEHDARFVFSGVTNEAAMAAETRQSVFATISSQVLGAFKYDAPPVESVLDLDAFVSSWGTVYITVPPERSDSMQAVVSAFVEAVTAAWRRTNRRKGTLLLALDEVANVAPLPNLPKIVTAGAGDGIQVILGMQDPSQANRWGEEAGVITGGTTHVAMFRGLRAEQYLSGISRLAQQEVVHDTHVTVVPELKHGPRLANERRLIHEREELERAMLGRSPRLGSIEAKRISRHLAIARLRDGIVTRPSDADDSATALMNEVFSLTRVAQVPVRRSTLEVSDIAQGRAGQFYLLTGARGQMRQFFHWSKDPFWNALCG